ncbi:uncharacterized protein VP01_1396g2 [Puccinia sorghi]|uniref:Inhibitor I9 domain-containing protein n=1 Tax=Puccinia sorghi TaxID=27349 RepID=A0A0L6VMX9_9BASI|nr:uncharacterized protein VP01_1396g2 [Puccinia sorghi]
MDSNHDSAHLLDRRDPFASSEDYKKSAPTDTQHNTDYIKQYRAFKKYLISHGVEIKHEYSLIKGYAVSLKPHQLQDLAHDPRIKLIEKDQEVHIQSHPTL